MERVLEAQRRLLGPDHEMTLGSQEGLAVILMRLGRTAEGRKLLDQALEARSRVYGPKSEDTMQCAYSGLETLAAAPDVSDEDRARAAELGKRLVRDAPRHQLSWKWLALAEYRTGNWDAAIEAARKCIEIRRDDGWAFLWLVLALAHERRGDAEEAREWYAKLRWAFENDNWADTPRWLVDEGVEVFGGITPEKQAEVGGANRPE